MKSNCLINSEVVRKWWASCTWALTSVVGTCLAWRHHGTRRSATCRWPERTAWRPASSAPSSSDNSHDALYNKHSHIYVLLRAIADKPAPAANYLESAVNHRPDLPTVILIIIGIPSPTHSLTLGLNPSFSADLPYRSLSFFSFRIHYVDFPDCLLLLLSISVFLLFSFFSVFTLF